MKKKIIYAAIPIALGLYYSGCTKEEEKECNNNHVESNSHQTANREGCEYCNSETSHHISLADAAQLIYNFKSIYCSGTDFSISNIGGTLILNQPTTEVYPATEGNFYNLKIHFCLQQTESGNVVSIAADTSKECFLEGDRYSTDESIGNNDYFSSFRENDIPMFSNSITLSEIESHLTSYSELSRNEVATINSETVRNLNNTFQEYLGAIHPCIAAYFNKALSIDIVSRDVNTNIYRYYFGYDPELENNKLRIILVGVDPETKENVCSLSDGSKMFERSWPPI